MAQALGNVVSNSYSGKTGQWCVGMDYDYYGANETVYQYVVWNTYYARIGGTVDSMGQVGNYSSTTFWDTAGAIWAYNGATSWKLTSTGAVHYKWQNVVFTWGRGTSAYWVGIYLTGTLSGSSAWSGTSTAGIGVTVPARNIYTIYGTALPAIGGTTTSSSSNYYEYSGSLTANANPGYEFDGWYSGSTRVGENKTLSVTIYGNTTYTAWFKALGYIMTLNDVNNPYKESRSWTGSCNVTYNESCSNLATLENPPTATGYILKDWKDSNNNIYTPETIYNIVGDVTATAEWIPINYTIQFHANGGTGTMDNMVCSYPIEYTLPSCQFVNEHRTFIGWTIYASNLSELSNTTTPSKGPTSNYDFQYSENDTIDRLASTDGAVVHLYAKWKRQRCKLTYSNIDAEIGNSATIEYDVNTFIDGSDIPILTRTGYNLIDWSFEQYTGTNQQKAILWPIVGGINSDTTIYPIWQPNVYYIDYQKNHE